MYLSNSLLARQLGNEFFTSAEQGGFGPAGLRVLPAPDYDLSHHRDEGRPVQVRLMQVQVGQSPTVSPHRLVRGSSATAALETVLASSVVGRLVRTEDPCRARGASHRPRPGRMPRCETPRLPSCSWPCSAGRGGPSTNRVGLVELVERRGAGRTCSRRTASGVTAPSVRRATWISGGSGNPGPWRRANCSGSSAKWSRSATCLRRTSRSRPANSGQLCWPSWMPRSRRRTARRTPSRCGCRSRGIWSTTRRSSPGPRGRAGRRRRRGGGWCRRRSSTNA